MNQYTFAISKRRKSSSPLWLHVRCLELEWSSCWSTVARCVQLWWIHCLSQTLDSILLLPANTGSICSAGDNRHCKEVNKSHRKRYNSFKHKHHFSSYSRESREYIRFIKITFCWKTATRLTKMSKNVETMTTQTTIKAIAQKQQIAEFFNE